MADRILQSHRDFMAHPNMGTPLNEDQRHAGEGPTGVGGEYTPTWEDVGDIKGEGPHIDDPEAGPEFPVGPEAGR